MRTRFLLFFFSALLLATALTFGVSVSPSAHAATTQQSSVSVANKPAVAAVTCPPTIRQGSGGWYVKLLQSLLNYYYLRVSDSHWFGNYPKDFGPYTQDHNNPLRVDGDFGSHTFNAVWDYQAYNGLSRDGEVGPQTWGSLGQCV